MTPKPVVPAASRTLEMDFPGLSIGWAEYDEGPTGCTVFLFHRGWTMSIDKAGGMVGTTGDYDWAHALCFAGGSLLGLEAASGVVAHLFASKDYSTNHIPLVNGAIIWDYVGRSNTVYPDKELGRAAAAAAVEGTVPLGRRGAGRSATVGKMRFPAEPGGQGAAFREFRGVRILVVTVVNAVGALIDREGRVVRGNRNPATGERRRSIDLLAPGQVVTAPPEPNRPTQNTTLTAVITDAKLTAGQLKQFGRQVHTSMSRAIDPFQTSTDGDTLFAVTSNQVEIAGPQVTPDLLGMVASEVAWDAVLSIAEDPV
ncbi:MAG: P1 family peptidase [bacterium]